MMNEWIISSSLLIAAVLLGRRLLRGRISLRLQYALWAVVLVRLLVPFQIFTNDFGAGSIAQDMDISEPVRQVYTSAREDDYERAYDAAYSQVVAEYLASSQTYDPVVVEREAVAQAKETIELDLNRLLLGVWFAGMVVMTSVIASCNVHLGLQLKRRRWELPVSDSLLPVYVTEAVPTPCIFGFFRPVIYLTPEAAGDEQVRRHVLAHELTHYRHWDHIWSVLRSACLILHWYNPLVWVAARVSRADAELACDEGALEKLGESHRADYGRTLIGLTCAAPISELFVTATTMTGSAGSIRERIRLLMKRPRNTILALIAVVLVGTIVVGCSFTGAPETTEPIETTGPAGSTAPGVDNDMSYQDQDLPIPDDPAVAEVIASLSEASNLKALRRLWNGWTGFAENRWVDLFTPEILDCVALSEDSFLVYYCRPGEAQTYAAEMIPHADGWAVNANSLVIAKPDGARDLTDEEIARVSAAFASSIIDEATGEGVANPLACLVNDYYDDVAKLDCSELLAYFPGSTDGTEREFELLKQMYPDFFGDWTWETMPIPIHCYDPETIDSVLETYADVSWRNLSYDGDLHYLEETGCYYNYTSDFGLLGFRCTGGWVTDEGAMLLSSHSALYLTERDGNYYIQFHVPAVVMPAHSSDSMTPAEAPAPISADFVGEEFSMGFSYICGDHTNSTDIGIVPSERLTDVRFGLLEWTEDGWQMDEVLCTRNFLEAHGGFLVEVVFGEDTVYGISFTDADGADRRFTLSLSGEGGGPVLNEYTPEVPSVEPVVAITRTVAALMQAYAENINLNRDNGYDHLTVLAADPEQMVRYQGRKTPLSDFSGNIEYLHGKEAYWKHVYKNEGIFPEMYQVVRCKLEDFRFEGDTVTVRARVGTRFWSEGQSGYNVFGTDFEVLLVRVDDAWLVADLTGIGDWFDAEYKNDPNFDPDALIASDKP